MAVLNDHFQILERREERGWVALAAKRTATL